MKALALTGRVVSRLAWPVLPGASLHAYAPAFNVALGTAAIPFAIATTRRPGDALDRMMADLSYIVYLQHWVAMQWFFGVKAPMLRRLEVAGTSFALVLPASWLIWRFYDQPINRLRARWVASRMMPLPASREVARPADSAMPSDAVPAE